VAALDWATWHLYNQPNHVSVSDWSTCLPLVESRIATPACRTSTYQSTCIPYHPATLAIDVIHATCHPFSGDTCHLQIGPVVCPFVQICLTRVAFWRCHVSPSGIAMLYVWAYHVSVWTCHVNVCTECTDCTVNNFFACLPYQTKRDIFSIRSPFDKVNIPPESGIRDRRNGIGFVAF
jgi:hypothetical protein